VTRRVYLDSSAYLAALLNEARAPFVRKAVEKAEVMSSVLLVAETKRSLVRLSREGRLPMSSYVTLMRECELHFATFALAPVVLESCSSGLMPTVTTPRTLDLLHLRAALAFHERKALTGFLTLDQGQANSAAELGLPVLQP
jgi:hypothetical protein